MSNIYHGLLIFDYTESYSQEISWIVFFNSYKTNMPSKSLLRQKIKSKLEKILDESIKLYSDHIFLKLSEKINDFQTRFVYLPMGNEIQTDKLIKLLREKSKTVLVPKINEKDEMLGVEYKSGSKLFCWKYWILEVENWQEFKWEIDVAIVPGLGFTLDWKRLWRWKWYYDKFLWKNKKAYKIWICMPQQLIKNIPSENHDIPMDEILY